MRPRRRNDVRSALRELLQDTLRTMTMDILDGVKFRGDISYINSYEHARNAAIRRFFLGDINWECGFSNQERDHEMAVSRIGQCHRYPNCYS